VAVTAPGQQGGIKMSAGFSKKVWGQSVGKIAENRPKCGNFEFNHFNLLNVDISASEKSMDTSSH
jgi:hypothetical protein